MRVIRTLLVLAVFVAVLGFFRGWFSFSGQSTDSTSNKVNVNLTVDPDKMKEDAGKVKDKSTEMARDLGDTAKSNEAPDDK